MQFVASQMSAGPANGDDFCVRCRIVGTRHGVLPDRDHLITTHNDGAERSPTSRLYILHAEGDSLPEKPIRVMRLRIQVFVILHVLLDST